jgi:hypothetical protein
LDSQGGIIDQGMIGSKFYNNQTCKQTNTSCLQHQGDTVMSKASSLAFSLLMKTSLVVDDDITCPSCIWAFLSWFQRVLGADKQIG